MAASRPNIKINLRHVFNKTRTYTYTGIITGTIEERDPWLNTIGSQSEDISIFIKLI